MIYRIQRNAFRCKGQKQKHIRDIYYPSYLILPTTYHLIYFDNMKCYFETMKDTGKLSNFKEYRLQPYYPLIGF